MKDTTLSTDKRPASPPGAPALFYVLTAYEPSMQSSRHSLAGIAEVAIGRGPRSARRGDALTLALPDGRLSSNHGRLQLRDGCWHVEDLGSKNGVYRNGVPVAPRSPLDDGDVIEMGYSFFVFRTGQLLGPDDSLDAMADALPAPAPALSTMMPGLAARFATLARIASCDIPILLLGETGTGKELAARAVHALSRRSGPLTAINCGGLPRDLLESELFGFKQGSFSGAVRDRIGLIASSHRGTLLLDEVAELPLDGQATLLRVLQEREVVPIGSRHAQPVDLRVVSATHHNLDAAVADGRFRADLHNRIRGFQLVLPPLRERREDLGLIVTAALDKLTGDRSHALSHAAARELFARTWAGNARELVRCLELATVIATGSILELSGERAPEPSAPSAPGAPGEQFPRAPPTPHRARPQPRTLRAQECERRDQLERLLREHHGNVTAVARVLGKAREQVHRWIQSAGLAAQEFRD